ncbi:MAG: protein kinase [Deltaproteobacteria bacterium]|nr:protein kinase [Deltaproteobacteria bacterium]
MSSERETRLGLGASTLRAPGAIGQDLVPRADDESDDEFDIDTTLPGLGTGTGASGEGEVGRGPLRPRASEVRPAAAPGPGHELAEGSRQRGSAYDLPLQPGMVVAQKFTLLRQIDEGGAGAVFEAEDMLIDRRVALKILLPARAADAEARRRFRYEALATARVNHPNVVTVLEAGHLPDDTLYLVQELLAGQTLREHLEEKGKLTVPEALAIVVPIMDALVVAHSRGIVHRDVKPENILLSRASSGAVVPKLIDFGIAKLPPGDTRPRTQPGSVLGTIQYMAPEQIQGKADIDGRADVWAMAVVLFELLAGHPPFDGTAYQIILDILRSRARLGAAAPDLPAGFPEIVERALEPDVAKRPIMQAFLHEVCDFSGRAGSPAPKPATGELPTPLPPQEARPELDLADADAVEEAPAPLGPAPLRPEDLTGLDAQEEGGSFSEAPTKRTFVGAQQPVGVPPQGSAPPRDAAEERTSRVPAPTPEKLRDLCADSAVRALGQNALDNAIVRAEEAIAMGIGGADAAGRMWLVESIAHYWLGNYAEAKRCGTEAGRLLAPGSTGYYSALGYAALVASFLGESEQLQPMVEQLRAVVVTAATAGAHMVAASRLAVALVRAGRRIEARDVLAHGRGRLDGRAAAAPVVKAWQYVALAEIESYVGDDMGAALRHIQAAVERFTAAGDVRNACLQKCHLANVWIGIGAHLPAERLLREVLAVAEPMKLWLVAVATVNLGHVLARLGETDAALATAQSGRRLSIHFDNRRFECLACIHLALIHAMRGELAPAASHAQLAIERSGAFRAVQAYGLSTAAYVLLRQGEPEAASKPAREAMALLEKLGGTEEGESFIRLIYASALHASGLSREAQASIREARARLLARAQRLADVRLRRSFLEDLVENRHTLRLASEWLGEAQPSV